MPKITRLPSGGAIAPRAAGRKARAAESTLSRKQSPVRLLSFPLRQPRTQKKLLRTTEFHAGLCPAPPFPSSPGYIPLVGEPKIKTTTDNVQLSPRAASSGPRSLDDPAPAAAWARPASLDTEAAQVRRMEDAPQQILNFLRDRGVDPEVARKAGVGWCAPARHASQRCRRLLP